MEKLILLPCKSTVLPYGSVIIKLNRGKLMFDTGMQSLTSKKGIVAICPYGSNAIFFIMWRSPSLTPFDV
jgi:hypothetical protein